MYHMEYDLWHLEFVRNNHNFPFLTFKQTVQHNAYDQDPYAKEFGMKISEKLASVEARILPAPWVIFIYCV